MKKLLLIIFLIFGVVALSGCGLIDRLQEWKNGEATQSDDPQQSQQGGDMVQPLPQEDVSATPDNLTNDNLEINSNLETREIVLYFADESGTYLQQETRKIPKNESIARTTIAALIDGPTGSGLLPTIPAATILDDINIKEGLCTVDFSSELIDNHPGGMTAEELTVYSIVNTLTQFQSVDEVKILVDGKEVNSIAGHVDVSTAMARNYDIMK